MNKRTKFNIIVTAWMINLACFIVCIFWKDYAISISAWYVDAIIGLLMTTGFAKIVLSFCLLGLFFDLDRGD